MNDLNPTLLADVVEAAGETSLRETFDDELAELDSELTELRNIIAGLERGKRAGRTAVEADVDSTLALVRHFRARTQQLRDLIHALEPRDQNAS